MWLMWLAVPERAVSKYHTNAMNLKHKSSFKLKNERAIVKARDTDLLLSKAEFEIINYLLLLMNLKSQNGWLHFAKL